MRDSVVPMFVLASLVACSDAKKSAPVETSSSTAVVEASAVAAASAAAPAREAAAAPVEAVAPSAAPSSSAASARARALADAKDRGLIVLLNTTGNAPSAATLPRRGSLAAPSASPLGDDLGDSFGAGGLGRRGISEGGGGRGEGISLSSLGTIGHGAGPGDGYGAGRGSGRLAASHGSKPSHATLGGKALADVRADDVRAALEKAGCTEVTRKENPPGVTSPTVFSAKKNGHTILVTFVAANDSPLAAADLSKLRDDGVVRQESGFVLAVQSDKDPDKSAARALLDALIVTT